MVVFSHCGKYAHTEAQNSPAMQNPEDTESQEENPEHRVDTRNIFFSTQKDLPKYE